jgi:hypothetical protein
MQTVDTTSAANAKQYGAPQALGMVAHTIKLQGRNARCIAEATAEYCVEGAWCAGATVTTLPPVALGGNYNLAQALVTVYGTTVWAKTALDVHNAAHCYVCGALRFADYSVD